MIELNLKTRAAAQTTKTYNSMCRFGDKFLGATDAGMFEIGGGSDNGVQIPMLVKSGMTDFGVANLKRFRYFYFGLESDGDCLLKVYVDGALAASMDVSPTSAGRFDVRVPVSRSFLGRYWAWSVENVDGSFVALYSVQALPIVLHHGRGRV